MLLSSVNREVCQHLLAVVLSPPRCHRGAVTAVRRRRAAGSVSLNVSSRVQKL